MLFDRNKAFNIHFIFVQALTSLFAEEVFLKNLLHPSSNTRFTDWGALLLSTQVRTIENLFCNFLLDNKSNIHASSEIANTGITSYSSSSSNNVSNAVNTAPILERLERLSQAVTILQLEKPSDWIGFRYNYEGGKEEVRRFLSREEVKTIMSLRVDFSDDAIEKACSS